MQPLFIGPYDIGAQKDLKPFMIPDTAFPELLNAFVWRGRVERKAGYSLLGRLRRLQTGLALPNTNGGGATSGNLLTAILLNDPAATLDPGSISIVVGAQTFTDPNKDGVLTNGGAGTGTVNYLTGAVTIQTSPVLAFAVVTAAFGYFPNLPAMGIRTREVKRSTNTEDTVFFDTKYAYRFIGTGFDELPSSTPTTWHGSDSQQFWTTNYQRNSLDSNQFWATNDVTGLHSYLVTNIGGAAFGAGASTANITTATANNFLVGDNISLINMATNRVGGPTPGTCFGKVTVAGNPFTISVVSTAGIFTNGACAQGIASDQQLIAQNNAGQDGIRIYTDLPQTWHNFNPAVNGSQVMVGCLMLIPYHNRMVALKPWLGSDTQAPIEYAQMATWSQNGDATDGGVGWRTDISGRGGFDEAATEEEIVSAGLIKDTLVVYFERSTWQLVYTGNEILPFTWQRINTELGGESTFSAVLFDNGVFNIGDVGIHTCNGVNVQRIDAVIPDEIYKIHNKTDGPQRVSGIRDYFQEIVYWAYPQATLNTMVGGKISFPDKMFIYNYRNNTFAFTDDAATCLGYFQRTNDVPWSAFNTFTWSSWNMPWNSPVQQAGFPSIAFGNQQGFIEVFEVDLSSSDSSLSILNIVGNLVTSTQHGLYTGDYVRILNCVGVTGVNNTTFQIVVTGPNTFTIDGIAVGTYTGGGTIIAISNLDIETKQFTPFWTKGKNYTLNQIDFLVDKTSEGELHVDVFVDFNDTDSMTTANPNYRLGNPTVATHPEGINLPYYSFTQQQKQIWKSFYTDATGETFQVKLSYDDTQMRTKDIVDSDVVIHAMIFWFSEAGDFY